MADVQVTVIGGGVIGRACAWQIAQDGASVRIVDSGEPRFGTSMANAGLVAPSHVIPFAAPGMVSMGITEFVKRSGAFGVKPGAGANFAAWSSKFMRACTDSHVAHGAPALREILHRSMDLFDVLTRDHGLHRAPKPLYYIFTSDKAEQHLEHEQHLFAQFGVPTSPVDVDTARREMPILKDTVKAALELSTDFGIDPRRLVEILGHLAWEKGTEYRDNETVTSLEHTSSHVRVTTDKDSWTSEHVVLAAGAIPLA
jgi:D-amino-acid dehydrogenase